jgi:hypothetical protein
MARRSGQSTSGLERLVSHIDGINPNGDVVRLAVYNKKCGAISLSWSRGYTVHSVNAGSAEGWQQEAARVWGLN